MPSLVGSEMCIRDRLVRARRLARRHSARPRGPPDAARVGRRVEGRQPVEARLRAAESRQRLRRGAELLHKGAGRLERRGRRGGRRRGGSRTRARSARALRRDLRRRTRDVAQSHGAAAARAGPRRAAAGDTAGRRPARHFFSIFFVRARDTCGDEARTLRRAQATTRRGGALRPGSRPTPPPSSRTSRHSTVSTATSTACLLYTSPSPRD